MPCARPRIMREGKAIGRPGPSAAFVLLVGLSLVQKSLFAPAATTTTSPQHHVER